jgi:hypothetical protein
MKRIALAALLAMGAASAMAQEVYGQVGTEGLGIGYTHHISKTLNIRGEINHFSTSYSTTSGNNNYAGMLTMGGVSVLGDLFPTSSAFRLTGGLVLNNEKLTATATPSSGTYSFNGYTYVVNDGDSISGKIKLGEVSPYFGIGYGHASVNKSGFSFFADAGIIFHRPKVERLSANGNVANLISDDALEAERHTLQGYANKLRHYPVLKVGVSYHF